MAAYFDDEPQGWELADWEYDDDFYDDNDYKDDNFWDDYCYKGGDVCVCEHKAECKSRRIHEYDDFFDNDSPYYGQMDGIPPYKHCYKEEPIEVKDVCEPKMPIGHSKFNSILFEGKYIYS